METDDGKQELINEILDKFIWDIKKIGLKNNEIIKNIIDSLKKMEV